MRSATRKDYRERIGVVVAYLAERLDDAPDLATLAKVGGFSPFWFHRIFVVAVGETPADISRRMRLERAAWHLRTTQRQIGDIALEAGFSDQPAFTRAFRLAYGAPPGQFRADEMPAHEIPSMSEIHFSPFAPFYRIELPNLERLTLEIEFVNLETRPYVYLRHLGAYPEIGASFEKMAGIAGQAGLLGPDSLFVGVYHDDPGTTPTEDLTSDAGVTVTADASTPDGLQRAELPAGRYAKGVHVGSYATMGESWGKFMAAMDASGAKMRPVSPFELYISDMETTPEDELITELYAAVE